MVLANYAGALDKNLGEFLLELKKVGNPYYRQFLNRYGDLTYCQFSINDSSVTSLKGLYTFSVGGTLKYVGRSTDSFARESTRAMDVFTRRTGYRDGQSTNCHVNALIADVTRSVCLHLCPMLDDAATNVAEAAMIRIFERYVSGNADSFFQVASKMRHALMHGDLVAEVEREHGRSLDELADELGRLAWAALLDMLMRVSSRRGKVRLRLIQPSTFLHHRGVFTAQVAVGFAGHGGRACGANNEPTLIFSTRPVFGTLLEWTIAKGAVPKAHHVGVSSLERRPQIACLRHFADLTRQGTPGFPCYFVASRAGECFTFFERFLTLDDGEPFDLMLWTQFILGSLEGWVTEDGEQRFQTAYMETSKGSG